MPVAAGALAVDEEPLRYDDVQVVPGASHGDIKQPALLLDFGAGSGREVGRQTPVDRVQNENRLPLLSFGRVDGREDKVVLVEQRIAGAIAGGVRRIERQLGQEPLAAGIGRGDLHELQQIGLAQHCIVIDALKMRFVPKADEVKLGRPSRRPAADQANRLDESGPMLGRRGRRFEFA